MAPTSRLPPSCPPPSPAPTPSGDKEFGLPIHLNVSDGLCLRFASSILHAPHSPYLRVKRWVNLCLETVVTADQLIANTPEYSKFVLQSLHGRMACCRGSLPPGLPERRSRTGLRRNCPYRSACPGDSMRTHRVVPRLARTTANRLRHVRSLQQCIARPVANKTCLASLRRCVQESCMCSPSPCSDCSIRLSTSLPFLGHWTYA